MQRKTATIEECAEALRQLSDADLRRLYEIGRLRTIGLKRVEGPGLLHEAIALMLEGKRRWPIDVPLRVFLRETMRSIASNHWRRQKEAVEVAESEIRANPGGVDGVIAMTADTSIDPEAEIGAAQILARIEEVFKDDEDALAVIAGKINGKSPGEIQQETELSATRYASTQRRIRRHLNRFFDKGESCHERNTKRTRAP